METLNIPTVKLYVKSLEKPVGTENIVIDKPTVQMIGSRFGNIIKVFPTHDVQTVTKYEYVLPEQQERLVEIIRDFASKSGFNLEVIDVAQMDYFDKPIPKEVKALNDFPVLAIDSQVQLILDFSREDIERFLSHVRREEKRI